jgi:hypothetical protein
MGLTTRSYGGSRRSPDRAPVASVGPARHFRGTALKIYLAKETLECAGLALHRDRTDAGGGKATNAFTYAKDQAATGELDPGASKSPRTVIPPYRLAVLAPARHSENRMTLKLCPICGKAVPASPRRPRRYCSDACRERQKSATRPARRASRRPKGTWEPFV